MVAASAEAPREHPCERDEVLPIDRGVRLDAETIERLGVAKASDQEPRSAGRQASGSSRRAAARPSCTPGSARSRRARPAPMLEALITATTDRERPESGKAIMHQSHPRASGVFRPLLLAVRGAREPRAAKACGVAAPRRRAAVGRRCRNRRRLRSEAVLCGDSKAGPHPCVDEAIVVDVAALRCCGSSAWAFASPRLTLPRATCWGSRVASKSPRSLVRTQLVGSRSRTVAVSRRRRWRHRR